MFLPNPLCAKVEGSNQNRVFDTGVCLWRESAHSGGYQRCGCVERVIGALLHGRTAPSWWKWKTGSVSFIAERANPEGMESAAFAMTLILVLVVGTGSGVRVRDRGTKIPLYSIKSS